jgi:hypothetical protein
MKFFSSELAQSYSKLTFGYANYGVLEPGDLLFLMYEKGYLPYSGSPASRGLFYMARSARIHLPDFELDSECRRVTKKFDGKYFREVTPLADFTVTEEFVQFWLTYYERALGSGVMPRERLMHILNFGIISEVGVYKDAVGVVGGYTLEVADKTMTHDWYQSYAPELAKQSFGVWLLIDIARAAKEHGSTYYYPGTVYGNSTDYKTNLPGLEFWSGEKWMKDANNRALKARTQTDAKRQIDLFDEWKENHSPF